MKIIYTVVSSDDSTKVTDVLSEHQLSVTGLATTGGLLKKGNSTPLIGTEEERVNETIKLIKDTYGKHQKATCNVPTPNIAPISIDYMIMPMTVEPGGATIFVTDVEHFEKI